MAHLLELRHASLKPRCIYRIFPMLRHGARRHAWTMPRYRREYVPGGTFFFTANLLERRRRLLVDHVDDLRTSFRMDWLAQPFEVIVIMRLPEPLNGMWCLPEGDCDNARPFTQIGSGFSR